MAPQRLAILRHAERPDVAGDSKLTPAGMARAQHFAEWFPENVWKPQRLIAAKSTAHSERPRLTLEPLSRSLGIAVEEPYSDMEHKALAAYLLADPAAAGKDVVVCWHHEKIDKLVSELGAINHGAFAVPWPDDLYALILLLAFDGGEQPALMTITEPF